MRIVASHASRIQWLSSQRLSPTVRLAVIGFLLFTQCWSTPIPSSHSKRIQTLLREAQASTSLPIVIKLVPVSLSPRKFQGHTNYEERQIVVTAGMGVSPEYDEAILAHELFHVVLNNKHFAAGAKPVPYTLQNNGKGRDLVDEALPTIASGLNSCFSDELIDREMMKHGFRPQLLLEREINETVQGANGFEPNEGDSWPDLVRHGQAMIFFCLAKRIPIQSMRDLEKKLRPIDGSTILDLEHKLIARFRGQKCQIDKPTACYKLTLQLRDAAGLKGIIVLRNPATLQPE